MQRTYSDYINRKQNFTINCQVAVDYIYCFYEVVVKRPGIVHDTRIFSNSSLSLLLHDKTIPLAQELLKRMKQAYPSVYQEILLTHSYHSS